MAGHIEIMEGKRNLYNVSAGKSEEKRSFGRSRDKQEHNVKKLTSKKQDWSVCTELIWHSIGTSGRLL
jgi:hypothetical protein